MKTEKNTAKGTVTKDDLNNEFLQVVKSDVQNDQLTTIFHKTEDYLSKHYNLRNNKISLDIEISKKDLVLWKSINENSLWIELQKNGYKVSKDALISILRSDFVSEYDPLKSYFENLPEWNKENDYIDRYLSYIQLAPGEDKTQFLHQFKKWCVRVVKCATLNGYFNKQAFVLSDDGNGQDIGKSSWCRFLCPSTLSEYIAEDIGSNDKDSRILLCKNILINLDELAVLSRKEINQLKSLFSKNQINERLPYDRKNTVIQRVASFVGSTNKSTFLQDETGSVRWLCFVVEKVDWKYSKEFNIDNLWSQAYALSVDPNFDETMTRDDLNKNEERNKKFQDRSQESQLLIKVFKMPEIPEKTKFYQATEIIYEISLMYAGIRLNNSLMGRALKAEGFNRIKKNGVYGYLVEKRICDLPYPSYPN